MRSFSWTLGALREILGGTLSAGRGAANQILGRDANLIQKLQMGSEHYDPRIAYLLGFPMAGASSAPTCKIIASAMASSGHFAFFGQSPKCELAHTSFRLAPPKSGMTTSIWRQEGARLMQSGRQPTEAQIQGVIASNPAAISQIMAQRRVDMRTAALILMASMAGIPQMASGGPLQAGQPALVGEQGSSESFVPDDVTGYARALVGKRGAEVFMPNVSGSIRPQYFDPPLDNVRPGPTERMVNIPGLGNVPVTSQGLPRPMPGTSEYRQWWEAQNPVAGMQQALNSGALKFNPEAWDQWLKHQPHSQNIIDLRGKGMSESDQELFARQNPGSLLAGYRKEYK